MGRDHFSRHDLTGMPHEISQQFKLPWLKLDQVIPSEDFPRRKIDLQISDGQ
jgi:hypothetical protein